MDRGERPTHKTASCSPTIAREGVVVLYLGHRGVPPFSTVRIEFLVPFFRLPKCLHDLRRFFVWLLSCFFDHSHSTVANDVKAA